MPIRECGTHQIATHKVTWNSGVKNSINERRLADWCARGALGTVLLRAPSVSEATCIVMSSFTLLTQDTVRTYRMCELVRAHLPIFYHWYLENNRSCLRNGGGPNFPFRLTSSACAAPDTRYTRAPSFAQDVRALSASIHNSASGESSGGALQVSPCRFENRITGCQPADRLEFGLYLNSAGSNLAAGARRNAPRRAQCAVIVHARASAERVAGMRRIIKTRVHKYLRCPFVHGDSRPRFTAGYARVTYVTGARNFALPAARSRLGAPRTPTFRR